MAELATSEPQVPSQQPSVPPPVAPDDTAIHRSLQSTLDVDPALLKKMDDVLGPSNGATATPTSDPQPGLLSGLWQKTKDYLKTNLDPSAIAHGFTLQGRQEQAQALLDTQKSAARGIVHGANELSNTAVGAAVGIEKKTGLYKAGRTKDQQDSFLKWWDQPTAKANPLQFPEDQINKWVGAAAPGTLNSLVEQSSQFLTGFAATGEMLPGLAATAGSKAKAVYNLAKAGITDATAFDPHIQRISNIVQNHLPPDSKLQALTFLASKDNDSDALGRFKASMEGLVLTSTIEGLSGGLSLLKVKGDPEAMAKVAAKTQKAVAAAKAEEVASVVPTPDGQFAVVLNADQSKQALSNIGETGFASGGGEATVQVPPGQAVDGADNTVAVMQKAMRIAGNDEFRRMADEEIASRGVKGNPDGEKAAIEETARKVVAKQSTFEKNVERSTSQMADVKRQQAMDEHPPEEPAPHVEKTLPPAEGAPSSDALLAYADQHNVPVQTALRAFQDAGHDVPDAMAKDAYTRQLTRDAPTYSSQGKAESVAAVVDNSAKNERLGAGSIDPEMVKGWKAALDHYTKNGDSRAALDILDQYGVNLKYTQTPEELLNVVKSLVDTAPEASTVARARPHTWAEVSSEASDLADSMGMDPDSFLRRSAQIFGSTQGLDTKMRALKLVLWKHADEVSKMARAATLNPENALAQDQLAAGLDSMLELHSYYTGAKSEIGRALNVEKMPLGDAAVEAEKRAPAAEVSPEETQAAADASGGTPTSPTTATAAAPAETVDPQLSKAKDELQAAKNELKAVAGPNTETVMDAAEIPPSAKGDGAEIPIEKQGLNDGTRDTQGVNANDFSRSRARTRAVAALNRANDILGLPQFDESVLADNRSLRGERVKMQGDAQAADPLTAPEGQGSGKPVNPVEELSKWIDQAETQLNDRMQKASETPAPKEQKQKLPEEVSPVDTHINEAYRLDEEKAAREKALERSKVEGDAGGATLGPSQTPSNAGGAPFTDPYQFVNRAPPTRRATEGLTREEIRSLANSVFLAEGDPNEILTLLRGPRRVYTPPPGVADKKSWFQNAWNFIHSYRMNAMLSGPKTQIANSISNTIMMLQRPLEYWMGGASTFNPELRQMGADMLGGMSRDLGESWSAARKSFLKGDNVLDPMNSPIQGSTASWGDASFLQKLFGAPSRMLMSADEFFKQMNYRANVRAQILRQARSQGVTDSAELGDRLTNDMQFAFDPNGGGVNPVALQYAKVSTFTNDLEGGIGQWIQEGAQKHPLIRTIFPFVRTTTQIFRNQWQRTPVLNMMNREFRSDVMAGGERRALAIAKTEMGVAMYGTAGMLAATGQITGAGPSDPQLRQQMKATGWQPYSIKIPGTDRYVSYRRIDPTFAAFGLVADAVQIDSELADSDRQNVSSAIVASIMSNLGSKTYMQGVTDFADAMSSGDGNKVEKLLSATATSFEPNILRQLNPDDTIRETRGLVDEFMSRTPGFSTKLEPRRNIFGEKILLAPGIVNRAFNPMTLSGPVDDGDVASKLVKLGRAFSMPSPTKYNGQIDLTNRDLYDNGSHQSPYDRMLELMGKPKDGEPSLRQQMEEFVKSDDYRNASEDEYVNQGGEKWNLANGIIQGAQQKSWANVLEEYPKLQQAIQQVGELQGASLDGGSSAVKAALQHTDNVLVRLKRTPK